MKSEKTGHVGIVLGVARTLASRAVLVAVAVMLGAASASAGKCPADKVLTKPRDIGDHKNHLTSKTTLEVIKLTGWRKIDDLNLRIRYFKIPKGGVVPTHEHNDRPSIVHVLKGQIYEHNTLCAVPILHKAGETTPEDLVGTPIVSVFVESWAPPPQMWIFGAVDFTAALAACFVTDEGGPALLGVSIGPVQEFIAASRSTSDLWAGSHLLSRIAWEAMRVVCEEIGPEAILFPRLRGVPQVDVWLRDRCGVRPELFDSLEWTKRETDANPLFVAALPNRFTALVPAARARDIAESITRRVREWARARSEEAFRVLLEKAKIPDDPELPGYGQIVAQLDDFPEVHWAAVPWSIVGVDAENRVDASDHRLRNAMRPFFSSDPPGFLGTTAWQLLSGGLNLEEGTFWWPNPGALYPAVHELLERLISATKSLRPFAQIRQEGWRCSLTGETEWLTTDRKQLELPPGRRRDTLWTRVADAQPSWARRGEHLGALATLKRLWPTLLVHELQALDLDVQRFVISTHAMAVAGTLQTWLDSKREVSPQLVDAVRPYEQVALPRKLIRDISGRRDAATLRQLPAWLDAQLEADEPQRAKAARLLNESGLNLEAYYGLLLMDGDRMGAWLSGDRELTFPHRDSFHPQIRAGLAKFSGDPKLTQYAQEHRAATPSRHMAISEALNHFALDLAPAVIEKVHAGRILYAGGDDVLAMLPVRELLPAMAGLRAVYSGRSDERFGIRRQENGFVRYGDRLMRVMGEKATISAGAVIAHHQAPFGAVLRALRAAEHRAKTEGGRDAFSLAVIKRSGGALYLTANWGKPIVLLVEVRDFLALPGVSRRAVYNSLDWIKDLPTDEPKLLATMLGYQFERQGGDRLSAFCLAERLAGAAFSAPTPARSTPMEWLRNFLQVAEFLAREVRTGSLTDKTSREELEPA